MDMSLVKPGVDMARPRVCGGNGVVMPGRCLTCNLKPPCVPSLTETTQQCLGRAGTVGGAGAAGRSPAQTNNQWFLGQHPAHTLGVSCGETSETATIVTSARN